MKKMMLCEPNDVRDLVYSTNSSYSFDDPKFVGCIAIASEQIEKYSRRKLAYGQRTDIFDVPATYAGLFRIYTTGIPVDVSSVNSQTFRPIGGSYSDANSSPTVYTIDPDNGVFALVTSGRAYQLSMTYFAGFKPKTEQPTKYGTGYEFYDCDNDLMMATAIQASFLMQRLMKNDTGKRGDEGSSVAKESVMNVCPDASKLLDRYVRPRYMGAR